MYDVGTWVRVAKWDYLNYVGYVTQNNPISKEYLINVTIGKWGYPLKKPIEIEVHEDYLYRADIEGNYDTSFLKDLAIDWSLVQWDEDLFNVTVGKEIDS